MKPPVASPISSASSTPEVSRAPDGRLSFRARRRGDVIILSARGEADAFTLPLWQQKVREAAEEAAAIGGAVVIDAARLDFLSLCTLDAVARDAHRYRRNGIEICLVTTDLNIARLAADDIRTAHLLIRSTVVSALTAITLRRQATSSTGRACPLQAPWITPDEGRAANSGRVHYRAGETISGPGVLPQTVAAASLPGRRLD